MTGTHALTMNHVGVSIPDIEAAVAWYGDTLGFTVIMAPVEVRNDGSHFGAMAAEIFGSRFGGMKLAHMVSGARRVIGAHVVGVGQAAEHRPVDVAGALDRLDTGRRTVILGTVYVIAGDILSLGPLPGQFDRAVGVFGRQRGIIRGPRRGRGVGQVRRRLPCAFGHRKQCTSLKFSSSILQTLQ